MRVYALGVTALGNSTLVTHGLPLVELVAQLAWFQMSKSKVNGQFIFPVNKHLLGTYNVLGSVPVLKYICEQNTDTCALLELTFWVCICGRKTLTKFTSNRWMG